MQATKTTIPEPAIAIHEAKQRPFEPLLMPVSTNDQIVRVWQNFNELKLKLLDDSDFVEINREVLLKKSGFRKLALAFGISCEITNEQRVIINEKDAYLITVKASAPNGRFMTSVGSCYEAERRFNKPSDIRAIAETRATNRAIANLIGWSTPSAEEMITEDVIEYAPSTKHEESDESKMTERQKKLLIQLIIQRNHDPEDRENALAMVEGLDKVSASQMITSMLKIEA